MDRADLRPSFRGFAAFTTALTGLLVALGVYTAATGSGLACSAQWPLCSGGVLPQTLPDFVEWFHRLVAMVVGFFILGTALWSWRVGGRAKLTATLALVLLPLQVSIGAVTVTLSGLIPGGYSPPTQAAHLLAALSIFTSLLLTTLFASDGDYASSSLRRTRLALFTAGGLLPISLLTSRVPLLFGYTPAAQAAFVLSSLALFAALVAAAFWAGRSMPRLRTTLVPALVLVFAHLLLGRDLLIYSPTVRVANAAIVVLAAAVVGLATWFALRGEDEGTVSESGFVGGD
ncbi:heme A synthase [Halobium salinum]|uniref:Heme A synthase n=1 Tax=Halobium salinum TaxID=1364940 RepID=A0ABD5P9B0_9EURY|nr:COX15/CtaA family protein [Halobium salinum]